MKKLLQNPSTLLAAAVGLSVFLGLAHVALADDIAAKPYKILATTQIPAAGGIDYVTADSVNRRVYVACGNAVSVFDLDTYKLAGTLANASGHGVAIDPENHTGLVAGTAFLGLAQIAPADDVAAKPYKILATTQIPAAGGIDYVTADSVNRRVYVACGNAVSV